MVKLIATVAVALLLAGCESQDEATTRIQKILPKGCELLDLGSYPGIDTLIAIRCPGSTVTTNATWSRWSGKIHITRAYAVALADGGRDAD